MRPDIQFLIKVMIVCWLILIYFYVKNGDRTIIWYIPYSIIVFLLYYVYSTLS